MNDWIDPNLPDLVQQARPVVLRGTTLRVKTQTATDVTVPLLQARLAAMEARLLTMEAEVALLQARLSGDL